MKLKQKDLPRLREELLKQQKGMCALCGTSLKKSEAQLDHCFPPEVELLTEKGFVSVKEVYEDRLKCVQWENYELSVVLPTKYIRKDFSGELVNLQKKSFSVLCTKEHNAVLVDRKTNENFFAESDLYFDRGVTHRRDVVVPKHGTHNGEGVPLTDDELRLYIAFHADGCFATGARFRLRKQRKIRRLQSLLNNCSVPYTLHDTDAFQVYIGVKDTPKYFTKTFNIDPFKFSSHQLKVLVEEIPHWDGSKIGNGVQYSTTSQKDKEYIRVLTVLAGKRGTEWVKERSGNHAPLHFLHFSDPLENDSVRNTRKSYQDYQGKVYCVSVPSGAVIIRHNGCVTVYGNCHTTGYCRAAVHRECNIMLGKMENFIKRYGKKFKDNPVMLQGFCFNVFNYMRQDYSHLPLHPKHTLPEEREIRKLRKAIKNAKRRSTKDRLRKRVKELKEELNND